MKLALADLPVGGRASLGAHGATLALAVGRSTRHAVLQVHPALGEVPALVLEVCRIGYEDGYLRRPRGAKRRGRERADSGASDGLEQGRDGYPERPVAWDQPESAPWSNQAGDREPWRAPLVAVLALTVLCPALAPVLVPRHAPPIAAAPTI